MLGIKELCVSVNSDVEKNGISEPPVAKSVSHQIRRKSLFTKPPNNLRRYKPPIVFRNGEVN